MGKRGGRGGQGSYNPQDNSNKIEKVIEKERKKQHPGRIMNSVISHTTNSSSASPVSGDQNPYDGYIFMCNGKTKTDCIKYRVFGLPGAKIDELNKIHSQTKLFLFDFDLRLLYGIFLPASKGELSIEPTAFGGRFSAQVRFQVYEDCLPLPESVFKPMIRDIYQGSKFRQELREEHVQKLISLFRPVAMSPSNAAVSLPAAVSLEQIDKPPGFEVYSEPGAERSDLQYQDLARPPHHPQDMGKRDKHPAHVSHTSKKLQGVSLQPVRAQPQLQQYYTTEAHSAYFPTLPEQELYKRNTVAPAHSNFPTQLSTPSRGNGHLSTKSLSAAYWISVANESLQKEMNPPCQSTLSANTGTIMRSHIPPAKKEETSIISQHRLTETDESSLAVATAVMVQPSIEDRPTPLPTSSSSLVAHDPNQVYSGLALTSSMQIGANHYASSTGGTTFGDYNYYDTRAATHNVPVQDHDPTAYYSSTIGVQAQAHNPTTVYYSANPSIPKQDGNLAAYYSATTGVMPQADELAAYYSGTTNGQAHDPSAAYYSGTANVQAHDPCYHPNTAIPGQEHNIAAYYDANTGISGQAHDQTAYYFLKNSYGHTQVPSSSQVPVYWDPNKVGAAATTYPI